MPIGEPALSFREMAAQAPRVLRVAVSVGMWGREPAVDSEHIDHTREAAAELEVLGHQVEEIDDDFCDWEEMWAGTLVNWIGPAQKWEAIADATGIPLGPETMEPVVWAVYQAAQSYDIADLLRMREANPGYTRAFGRLFEDYDVLLTPSDADAVPLCGPGSGYSPFEPVSGPAEGVQVVTNMVDTSRYLIPANDAGFPALAIPTGLGCRGVPIGVQLQSAWGSEGRLLGLAAALEEARSEWFAQRPPVHITRL